MAERRQLPPTFIAQQTDWQFKSPSDSRAVPTDSNGTWPFVLAPGAASVVSDEQYVALEGGQR